MSAQANIVLNDGQTTPVAQTFNPKGVKANQDGSTLALWRNQAPFNQAGWWVLTERHNPVNGNGMEKFIYTFDLPTLESPSSGGSFVPPPTRAFGTIGRIEVWAHERAVDAELKNIVAMIKNFTASTLFSDNITKREAAW